MRNLIEEKYKLSLCRRPLHFFASFSCKSFVSFKNLVSENSLRAVRASTQWWSLHIRRRWTNLHWVCQMVRSMQSSPMHPMGSGGCLHHQRTAPHPSLLQSEPHPRISLNDDRDINTYALISLYRTRFGITWYYILLLGFREFRVRF